MNIIIMGPQGSGKGTQAQISSEKLNIPHISTGDIFRENIKNKTELGKKIEIHINRGELVSDDIVNAIIKDRLEKDDCRKGFILDGYPRDIEQARFLDSIVDINLVLDVRITDDESIKRIGNRRSCAGCGYVYHLITNPPAKPDTCDHCSGKLVLREDDQEGALKIRLSTYHKRTEKLIKYYEKQGVYKKINGMHSIEEVDEEISKLIK